jgi:inositol 1,4,5-triphosphate receptor type 1
LDGEDIKEGACDTLRTCILTTMNHGLRNGGGIGDILRPVSYKDDLYNVRVAYDLAFFFVLIVIVLNLILGIIIDTFADLRKEKQEKDELRRNSCFICGLERHVFDAKGVSFERHCKTEHFIWSYLNFIVLLKTKDPTELNGPESYVYKLVCQAVPDLTWFPRLMAMSLKEEVHDDEHQLIKSLHDRLNQSADITQHLSQQLKQLQVNLSHQRREATRLDMQEQTTAAASSATLLTTPGTLTPTR